MKVEVFNREAQDIWKNAASDASSNRVGVDAGMR